jgi:thioredoxin-like negative regulator of GroEL
VIPRQAPTIAAAVEDLTDETFAERIGSSERAVVDFWASWCGACVIFKPKLVRLARQLPHVAFFAVDAERAPEARASVTIEWLPYFAAYRAGRFVGGISTNREDVLIAFVGEHFG